MVWFRKAKKEEHVSPEEQREKVREGIDEARHELEGNPKKAINALHQLGKRFYNLCSLEGDLHREYQDVVTAAWSQQEKRTEKISFSAVGIVPWETWKEPQMGDVAEKARDMREDIVYLTPPERRHHRDALAELEALKLLCTDERIVLVVIGEEAMMATRSFLLQAGERINPNSEDIGMDLSDLASQLGLRTECIIA